MAQIKTKYKPPFPIPVGTIVWTEYDRKSSDESSGHQVASIGRQQEDNLRRFPEEEFPRAFHFQEEKSAFHSTGRDDFDEIVRLIEGGKTNGLIVYHPNRLSRNAISAGIIVDLIQRGKLKDIKFYNGSFENSPEGIMMLQITLSQGQYESSKLSKDVKSGNRYAFLNKKKWIGVAPVGYLNYTDEITKETKIKIDPIRFPLLKEAFYLILYGGATPMEALKRMNDNGFLTRTTARKVGKPLHPSIFYNILNNSFYYGLMKRKLDTEVVEIMGTHEPLITEEEFNKIQIILGKKGKPNISKHNFAYRSAFKCSCGGTITGDQKWQTICTNCKFKFASMNRTDCPKCRTEISAMRSPTILHKVYYHCNKGRKKVVCNEGSIEIKQLEETIKNNLDSLSLVETSPITTIQFIDGFVEYITKLNREQKIITTLQTTEQDKKYKELETKLENLKDCALKLMAGQKVLLSETEIIEEKEQTKQKMDEIIRNKQITCDNQSKWFNQIINSANYVKQAREALNNPDPLVKTNVLRALGSNITLTNRIIAIDEYKHISIFKNYLRKTETILEKLEPRLLEQFLSGGVGNLSENHPLILVWRK